LTDNKKTEYDDDTAIVPRSSMVVARRLPAARAGHGKAARYVSGKMPTAAKSNYRSENAKTSASGTSGASSNAIAAMSKAQTEQEKLAAMFAAEGDEWEQQQQQMAK
jgi:protein MPE1